MQFNEAELATELHPALCAYSHGLSFPRRCGKSSIVKEKTPADSSKRRAGPPERWFSVRALHAANMLFSRVFNHVIVREACRLPRAGAAILVCNHTSGLDPLFIQAVTRRLVIWMTAKEYMEIKGLNIVFRAIMAIPVERSGRDMAAMRAALRTLHEGRILGVFPEGKIEKTTELLPFQPGVALMAIKAGVPVYPAYIDGTMRGKEMLAAFRCRNQASLRFGPVVEFDRSSTSRENLDDATAKITAAVAALKARQDARGLIDLP